MEETIQPVDETTETTPSQEQTDSTVEVKSEESEVVSDVPAEGESESTSTKEEGKRSQRQEKRFAQMSSKIRELSEQSTQQPPNYFGTENNLNPNVYPQTYSEAPSYDYNQDVARQAEMIADLKLQQFEQKQQAKQIAENFERDVDLVERKYPELNAEGEKYDSALSNKIASMYEKLSTKNPDIRLRDIVDDVMEVASRQTNRASAEVSASVAKAAAETTLKPDTTSKDTGRKDFSELSLDEMEQQLGFQQ
jgi:hypothetical protein